MLKDNNLVSMGKIVSAFGIHGWVKIKTSANPDNLQKHDQLHVLINNQVQMLKIEKLVAHGDILNTKFVEINDRDQALALRGAIISVSRDDFPQLAADEYYWTDLIGLKVINQQQELIGIVDSLMDTGANSVLVIKGEKQHLIPFVANYVIDVNMQDKCISVDWGLDY
jgi:16S rRNA processing protein RimM